MRKGEEKGEIKLQVERGSRGASERERESRRERDEYYQGILRAMSTQERSKERKKAGSIIQF